MAKPQETQPQIDADQQISLSFGQLQELLGAVKTKQDSPESTDKFSATLEKLVEAVIESRKPFVDPGKVANEDAARTQLRQQEEFKRKNIRASQDNCPHKQGLGGQRPGDDSAFWLYRSDTGEVIGICSYCQKVITSLNPDHQRFFNMRGSNTMAQAGQRQFWNPMEAQLARFSPDERREILEKQAAARN